MMGVRRKSRETRIHSHRWIKFDTDYTVGDLRVSILLERQELESEDNLK